ncbi:MAG: pilus assembly protein PilM [Candidatus Omnitrophota bacterium]
MDKGITTVLEITQTHVKLIQAKSKPTGKIISSLEVREISEITNEAVAKTIKGLISESKIEPDNLICIIPRSSTIVRNLRLPSHDPSEIEDMLDFQIKQQIPYAQEDIISDYINISKDVKGYSDVLLVTAHKSVVERYLKILRLVGIDPEIFSLSSMGVNKWYNLSGRPDDQAVLLVNIDSVVSDLCFCSEGNLIFSRSVSFGLNDINNEKLEGFIEQIHLTLATYRKEKNNPDISKIVLITQSDKLIELSGRLKSEFSLPVEKFNPLDKISKDLVSEASENLENISLTASLGLALSEQEAQLNLLPDEVHDKQKARSLNKELVRSCAFLALAIILASIAVSLNIYKKQNYLKQIEAALEEIKPSVKMAEQATQKLSLIRKHLTATDTSIDIIYELYNILPAQMSLNVFSLDEQDNITLQGVSNQMSDIFSFQSSLEKSTHFKNVEVKYASKRRTREGEMTDFRITCQVNRE